MPVQRPRRTKAGAMRRCMCNARCQNEFANEFTVADCCARAGSEDIYLLLLILLTLSVLMIGLY